MGFTKTIVQHFSDITPFNFIDFMTGLIFLIEYGIDNRINIRVTLQNSPLSEYLRVDNYNTRNYPVTIYHKEDIEILFTDLDAFKNNHSPLLVLSTNCPPPNANSTHWSGRYGISDVVLRELLTLVQFKSEIYSEANSRVAFELLNINSPHITPTVKILLPGFQRSNVSSQSDYSIIYININPDIHFKFSDTKRLADSIRSSLSLNRNIILLSNDKRIKLWLSAYLTGPCLNNHSDYIMETEVWNLEDSIVNFILLLQARNVYVYNEQSSRINKEYYIPSLILTAIIQEFNFYYSKIEIIPGSSYNQALLLARSR